MIKEQKKKRKRFKWLKELGEEILGTVIVEFIMNILLFIPRLIIRVVAHIFS